MALVAAATPSTRAMIQAARYCDARHPLAVATLPLAKRRLIEHFDARTAKSEIMDAHDARRVVGGIRLPSVLLHWF